jgi:transketolase
MTLAAPTTSTSTTTGTGRTGRPDPAEDALAVATIRHLAVDMVEAARSGHPGMPLGTAPMAWALWSRHLRHDPGDPGWADRDRFVLSAGHGSALLYALLHVSGYDLPMEEVRRFRQLGSRTPGHPEVGHTVGVETTTGPLGQGLATAVGMALAERMAAARYPGLVDHRTFVLVGDGCLMEGISHEAASLAGTLGLGKLVVLFDDNDITIDGAASESCRDDQLARFAAYGWHVLAVPDGEDVDAVDAAVSQALEDPRPSFIAVRTVIGRGAPGIEGTSAAHGAPLGPEVVAAMRAAEGWEHPAFTVPDQVRATAARLAAAGRELREEWQTRLSALADNDPAAHAEWTRTRDRVLPDLTEVLRDADTRPGAATRQSSQAVLRRLVEAVPELVGGSADLAGSTGTDTGRADVTADDASGATLRFGVREAAMAAVLNGLSLHGGFRPFGSTFLVFSDYLRPALRLSALMRQPVIYVLTHDSVAVGEDGPTHQPIEHVEALRVVPGLTVLRPADGLETAAAWRAALERTEGPTALVLTRQAVPALPGHGADLESLRETGSRVVREADRPDVTILATGSEVSVALGAADLLDTEGARVEVVSVLDRDRWARTGGPARTRGRVTVTVEAGVTSGWRAFATPGGSVGIDDFGASGPGSEVMAHVGITSEAVAGTARRLLDHQAGPGA